MVFTIKKKKTLKFRRFQFTDTFCTYEFKLSNFWKRGNKVVPLFKKLSTELSKKTTNYNFKRKLGKL